MKTVEWIDSEISRIDGYIKSFTDKMECAMNQVKEWDEEVEGLKAQKQDLLRDRGKLD